MSERRPTLDDEQLEQMRADIDAAERRFDDMVSATRALFALQWELLHEMREMADDE